MNFDQLHYFSEIYRQRSIAKAAENLYIFRQSLTMSLNKLEKELNVQLFFRSHHGVVPTEAAHEFFQSVQLILGETIKAFNGLLKYNSNHIRYEVGHCKIAIAEVLISLYGDMLLEMLSSIFSEIYFDFSVLYIEPDRYDSFYHDYDISIPVLTESIMERYNSNSFSDSLYSLYNLKSFIAYVWIDRTSPLAFKKKIFFEELKSEYSFCNLKGSYNFVNFIVLQNLKDSLKYSPDISLKNNFIDHVSKFGYITFDYKIKDRGFIYKGYFPDHIVARPTDQSFHLKIIYKNYYWDIVSVIASFLSAHV